MTAGENPLANKNQRRPGDAKRRMVGTVNYASAPQLHQEMAVKPATRSKSGCMTCRIRRKKCDLEREGDSCRTCARLRIECLGWGAKRPDALRDPAVVKECQHMIKVFLASNNMIKGSARSAVTQPANPGSPSSSSSANALGGAAGDGQPPYAGANFLTFENLKRDGLGNVEAMDGPKGRPRTAPRRSRTRGGQAPSMAPAADDEDADGSVEDFDESMDYSNLNGPETFSRLPQAPNYPPPPMGYDPQYGQRYNPYQGPQASYPGPVTHPYAQSAVRTGSHDLDKRTNHEDNFRELEREREREMDHYHRAGLSGPPPATMAYPYPQNGSAPYRTPPDFVYGPGVGTLSPYGHSRYPDPLTNDRFPNNVLAPMQTPNGPYGPPPRFSMGDATATLRPITTAGLSASPGLPMARTPSHQDSEGFSAQQDSPEQAMLRSASLGGTRYRSSSNGGRAVGGVFYPGESEMIEGDVDGEPIVQNQPTIRNPFLPSGSSFGQMYQFDREYSDPELLASGSALIPAMSSDVTQIVGTMNPSQFVAAMTAIGMTDAGDLTQQMNLAPNEITTLEHFHQQLSAPAHVVSPIPFFDVYSPEAKQLNKQLELLYMYRGKLCNLQYHIAHSTDNSIADELFNFAMTSQSALYGTLTLTSLFKIMTRDVNNGPLDEALLELQYFKDQVAKRLGQQMRDPANVDSGDAMAGLHMVSAILFEGGTNAQWEKFLDVAKTWVQKHPVVTTGSWQDVRTLPAATITSLDGSGVESTAMTTRTGSHDKLLDKKNLFIIKATAWFDVIGSVTMRRKPHFLTTYQELFGRQGGAAMEQIMGCDEKVLLAIAETAALAEWRHEQEKKNQLSFMDLAGRAHKIEPLLEFIGPVYNGQGFIIDEDAPSSPASTVDEIDLILGTTAASPSSTTSKTPKQRKAEQAKAAHQIRLVSNVFRAAGKLYLHTVVSSCNPDVKEIKDAVAETVTAFENLEASTTDRSLVFPIALAGCMTDSPAYRSYLVSRLKALGKEGEAVGNTKSCLQLMQAVWMKRDKGPTRNVDWIDTMREMGWSLLLA